MPTVLYVVTRLFALGGLVAAVLVGAACSSGVRSSAGQTAAPPQPTTSSATPAAGAQPCARATPPAAAGGGDVLVPGDIPDNQAYVAYQSTRDGYRMSVPEGWARTAAGGAVMFTDKFNSIRVEVTSAPSAPSAASAQSTVATLAASAACFQAGKISTVARTAGSAVLITYRADSAADPVTGKVVRQDVERYELWNAGKLAAITLSSSQGSDNVDPWRKVTDSFTWGP